MSAPADGDLVEDPSSVVLIEDSAAPMIDLDDLEEAAGTEDDLLDCLVFLSRFHGNPKSPECWSPDSPSPASG
ncbi:MAG: hypothetical protein QF926_03220 [Alphaproteobacteria bacterium]|jgi:hypothetical protein|nr:hypothetical protein [Alphaproteobacteria bacterium]MDP6515623.1 hypothetical protein [Alphaproteobacteria bacterium]